VEYDERISKQELETSIYWYRMKIDQEDTTARKPCSRRPKLAKVNPTNAILDCNFEQTFEKLILKVADGGHFGFLSPKIFPHTFWRGTLSYFI